MAVLRSIDDMLAADVSYGMFRRVVSTTFPAVTAANTTSGSVTGARASLALVLPAVTSPVLGYFFTYVRAACSGTNAAILVGLEYTLGSIDLATGTFTSGVAMPTKTIEGSSVQTATLLPMMYVSSGTNGTPVLTVTYTNESGSTGRTASMTLPGAPVSGSAYLMTPHLQTGDSGVRAVTGISRTGSTIGTVTAVGILPLGVSVFGAASYGGSIDPLSAPLPMFMGAAGETVAFYKFGGAGSTDVHVFLAAVPET